MSDSALSVQYRKFRYQAQSHIADHGYWTKCPPMDSKLSIINYPFPPFLCTAILHHHIPSAIINDLLPARIPTIITKYYLPPILPI